MIDRVLFLQPRTFAGRNYMNSFGEEQRWTPWFAIALAPIARRAGMSVELLDARVDLTWQDRICNLGTSDLLAVSVMTGNAIRDAVWASERAREMGAIVVWGGPHASLFPDQTLREAPVDGVIHGFGYEPFTNLVNALKTGTWPHSDTGFLTSQASRTPLVTIGPSRLSVNSHPPSAWMSIDLVDDWGPYLNADVAIAERTANLITSEGCPRKCTFCSEPKTSNGRWLTSDVHAVVDLAYEISSRSGANGFKLHDPNFFHDFERAAEFADSFSGKLRVPWAATMHPADLARFSEHCLATLAHNGLRRVLVGLESPDASIVKLAGKQYDVALIPDLVKKLADAGIRGMFTFIVGWPNADPGHYGRTIAAAKRIRDIWHEHQAKIHFLEPWPGTPIFNYLVRNGFVSPSSLEQWADIDYYQADYASIHDARQVEAVRQANKELSPYVDA